MGARKTSRIQIPCSSGELQIVGILEQLQPDATRGIALILHGTMGHKDYLYQRRLVEQLPCDSFRFDFRGNHESTGKWRYGDILGGSEDIQGVVDYLRVTFGYAPQLIVGHSLGSLAAFYWLCHTSDGQHVPAFVNVSARHRMWRLYGDSILGYSQPPLPNDHPTESNSTKAWQESFPEKGYHDLTVSVAKNPVTFRIYQSDFEKFANWDMSFVWSKFPSITDVLTIHGLSDITVLPTDALIYAKALSNRSSGTHALHLMEGADHNFVGHQDELIGSILEWWELKQRNGLSSGIWLPRTQQGTKL